MNKETLNIYLNNDGIKNDILTNSSPYEKYIIHMNDTLQSENKTLQENNHSLETRITELENENESFDNSKRYTRGLLKNLVELDKLKTKVVSNNKIMYQGINKYIKTYIDTNKYMFRILETVLTVIMAIIYHIQIFDVIQFLIFFSTICCPVIFVEIMFNKFKLPNYSTELALIHKSLEEIEKINDSQDFLNEYIDCI